MNWIIYVMGIVTGISIYKIYLHISFMRLQKRIMNRLEKIDKKQDERGG